jgi:AmiR/NasT family two-component response regulator
MSTPHSPEPVTAALAANRRVNIAIGMLMRRYTVDQHAAFRMLTSASQLTGRTVAALAQTYIQTGNVGLGL